MCIVYSQSCLPAHACQSIRRFVVKSKSRREREGFRVDANTNLGQVPISPTVVLQLQMHICQDPPVRSAARRYSVRKLYDYPRIEQISFTYSVSEY